MYNDVPDLDDDWLFLMNPPDPDAVEFFQLHETNANSNEEPQAGSSDTTPPQSSSSESDSSGPDMAELNLSLNYYEMHGSDELEAQFAYYEMLLADSDQTTESEQDRNMERGDEEAPPYDRDEMDLAIERQAIVRYVFYFRLAMEIFLVVGPIAFGIISEIRDPQSTLVWLFRGLPLNAFQIWWGNGIRAWFPNVANNIETIVEEGVNLFDQAIRQICTIPQTFFNLFSFNSN